MEAEADAVEEAPELVPLIVEAGAPLDASPDEVPPEVSVDETALAVDAPPSVLAGEGAFAPPLKSVTYQPEPLS